MKEIIFRGMRTDNGEWVEGYLWKGIKHAYIIPIKELAVYDRYTGKITVKAIPVIPETVGQEIGLTDKNGKKICDGDIIRVADTQNAVVEYDEKSALYKAVFDHAESDYSGLFQQYPDVVVIGNVFNNPELLGGK